MANALFNNDTNVINIARNTVENSAASHWDVTICAYGNFYVFHVKHMTSEIMLAITQVQVRTSGVQLRGLIKDAYKNANKYFEVLRGMGFEYHKICSAKDFQNMCKWARANHKRNAGETAEQLLRDFYGLDMYWYKDSTPGTVAGDMVVNGVHIQHKHQNATFAH